MSTPTPAEHETTPVANGYTHTEGDVWAFRAFAIMFLLTLLIGFVHFLLSYLKYRT